MEEKIASLLFWNRNHGEINSLWCILAIAFDLETIDMPIVAKSNIWMTDMAFSSHWHLGNRSLGTIWSADI